MAVLADATIYSLIEKYEKLSEIFTNFPVVSGAIEYIERQNRSALVSHLHLTPPKFYISRYYVLDRINLNTASASNCLTYIDFKFYRSRY